MDENKMNDENDITNKNEISHKIHQSGGKALASGGFGCVFSPALKCVAGSTVGNNHGHASASASSLSALTYVSKLMEEKYAKEEWNKIQFYEKRLHTIPKFQDYFVLSEITLCKPAKLGAADLAHYNSKCPNVFKRRGRVTARTVNKYIPHFMSLNLPNMGVALDDYVRTNPAYSEILRVHRRLQQLLRHGIIPMNHKHIYHCDIKDSNILVDHKDRPMLYTRLIDWGLAAEYTPRTSTSIPHSWRNRPFQFNVPFSVILFSDLFHKKYDQWLQTSQPTSSDLRPFLVSFIAEWMDQRGEGHYPYINEIMTALYTHHLSTIAESNKKTVIETELTMSHILDYLIAILQKYTSQQKWQCQQYINQVYIHNVDLWGFVFSYYSLVESLSNHFSRLSVHEKALFTELKAMYLMVYETAAEPLSLQRLQRQLTRIESTLKQLTAGAKTSSLAPTQRSTLDHRTIYVDKPATSTLTPIAHLHTRRRQRQNKGYVMISATKSLGTKAVKLKKNKKSRKRKRSEF